MIEMSESVHSLEPVFDQASQMVRGFKKNEYARLFTGFLEDNKEYFAQLDLELSGPEAPDFIIQHAKAVAMHAECMLNDTKSKISRGNKQLDLNMFMAVYFLPAILEEKHERAAEFTDRICAEWNERFKDGMIRAADYRTIAGGFKTKLCYITTAVCRSMNKPEDCYELNLLKNYRDDYLLGTSFGEELVRRYYNIAPTIVKRINASANADKKYKAIWQTYLKPCIALIENGSNEECSKIYIEMVEHLQEEYVSTRTK